MPKKAEYVPKGITTHIEYEASMTVKVGDRYYKECMREARDIPAIEGVDVEKERQALIDKVHDVVDNAVMEVIQANGGK